LIIDRCSWPRTPFAAGRKSGRSRSRDFWARGTSGPPTRRELPEVWCTSLFGSSCSQVFHYGRARPYHQTHLLLIYPSYIHLKWYTADTSEALTLECRLFFCFVFGLGRTRSLPRKAIEKVTREGYKEDPLQGGHVFLDFLGCVIKALGPQWAHFHTDNLELQRRVARLYRALQHQKEAEAHAARPDSAPFPPLREGPLSVIRANHQSSMNSEQTTGEY
jgi:hypothetical protein